MKKSLYGKLGVFILFLTLALIIGWLVHPYISIETLQVSVQKTKGWAPLLFVLIYMFATVFFMPGIVMTLSGGFLFGAYWGTLLNLLGATLGATVSFLIARYTAHEWVNHRMGQRLPALQKGIEDHGWKYIAVLRLAPVIPFNLVNYALGLTPVRLKHYVGFSFIFMFPGCFAFTYLGTLGNTALVGETKTLIVQGLTALTLLMIVGLISQHVQKKR